MLAQQPADPHYARRVLRRAAVPLAVTLLLAAGYAFEARRSGPPTAELVEGVVVAIHDGDTLTLEIRGAKLRVRLAQIDAPERGQPWGRRARRALAELTDRRAAKLRIVDRDDYGRTVGDLFVGSVFVNEALVRAGHAWSYPRYVRSPEIPAAEQQARSAARGLWGLPAAERTPPWQWRREHPRGPSRRDRAPE